jgi:predicted DNA-binding transcriptional regulator AlpA
MPATTFKSATTQKPISESAYNYGQSPLMPFEEALAMYGGGRTAFYASIARGDFPAPVSLGPRRSNGYAGKSMWVRPEVMAWLEAKIAEPRALGPAAKSRRTAEQSA